MERSLLETAQLITRLSTTVSSARLAEAIRLFEQGDNKGADAVLNLVEIDRDAAANAAVSVPPANWKRRRSADSKPISRSIG